MKMIKLAFSMILITEIMFDPSPGVGLPDAEYIEIHNPGVDTIDLTGWHLIVGSKTISITPQGYSTLFPPGYMLLTSSKFQKDFASTPSVTPVDPWPTLSNSGAGITLTDSRGQLIHSFTYHPSMIHDNWKADGGWSLELIDFNLWGHPDAWQVSTCPLGGTPGLPNSPSQVSLSPQSPTTSIRLFPLAGQLIACLFSAPLHPVLSGNDISITMYPGAHIAPQVISTYPNMNLLTFTLPPGLDPEIRYKCRLNGNLYDYAGKPIVSEPLNFGFSSDPAAGDLVINEIMFDPDTNDFEFLEIFNCSDKIIEPSNLVITRGDPSNPGTVTDWSDQQPFPYLLFPGTYAVVCKDSRAGNSEFPCIIRPDLPVLTNSGGWVAIETSDHRVIDEAIYHADWHHPLLKVSSGVSLERIDPGASGCEQGNWMSSADQSGHTAGCKNSQRLLPSTFGETLAQSDHTVDFQILEQGPRIVIRYTCEDQGWYGRCTLYDRSGHQVLSLRDAGLLGSSGIITWDGYDRSGGLLPAGFYLIISEFYTLTGDRGRWKRACYFGGSG